MRGLLVVLVEGGLANLIANLVIILFVLYLEPIELPLGLNLRIGQWRYLVSRVKIDFLKKILISHTICSSQGGKANGYHHTQITNMFFSSC